MSGKDKGKKPPPAASLPPPKSSTTPSPPQPKDKKLKMTNPFLLPSPEEVDEDEFANQSNTLWKWILGLGGIMASGMEVSEASAVLASKYILLVPEGPRQNAKWTTRTKDANKQVREGTPVGASAEALLSLQFCAHGHGDNEREFLE
jgi:hypothetical protein